jgi:hypothetical protein
MKIFVYTRIFTNMTIVQILEIRQATITIFFSWIDILQYNLYYSQDFSQCRLYTEPPKYTTINLCYSYPQLERSNSEKVVTFFVNISFPSFSLSATHDSRKYLK